MARAASPFYYGADSSQLGADLGQSLGTALFGNPQAAAALAYRKAQMANLAATAGEANAHAGLYTEQTAGEHNKNVASGTLPDLIRGMFATTPQPTPQATPNDPPAPLPDAQPPAGNVTFDPQTFRNGLPGLMGALAQAQGDKLNPNKIIGGLSAFMGDDEFARRGMVGDGVTPGKDFALTPQRADDIAARDAAAKLTQADSVANIQSKTQMRGQDVSASTQRRGQDVSATTQRRGQDIEHGDRIYGIQVKEGADIANPGGGNVLARALGPGAVITSNARTPAEQANVYATQHPGVTPPMNSGHLDAADGYPAFDVRPLPGMTFEQARQAVSQQAAAQGGYLGFAQDEGTHWHFDIRGVKSGKAASAASSKPPRAVNAAGEKMIDTEIDNQLASRGLAGQPDPGTMANIRSAAIQRYQQSGNPAAAVGATLDRLQQAAGRKGGGGGGTVASGAAPVAGARKAPDGNWYVRQGNGYARVDVSG